MIFNQFPRRITSPFFRCEWQSSDDGDDDDDDVVIMPVMVVVVVIMILIMVMMILNGSGGDVDQHHLYHLHNIGLRFKDSKG